MFALNKNPSRRELAVFSALLPVALGVVGTFRFQAGSITWAFALWALGLLFGALAFAVPAARRWLYFAWTYATFPIAWSLSQLILVCIYFMIATPIALLLRALRIDPLQRRIDKAAPTYWIARDHRAESDAERYFRQF